MWNFKSYWEEKAAIYEDVIAVQLQLYDQIKNNECIHWLFSTILAVGNVLNAGSNKGQADGFDIEVLKLSKPSAIKDCNGKSLLVYACNHVIKEFKDFPVKVRALNKFVKESMKKADIEKPHTELNDFFETGR